MIHTNLGRDLDPAAAAVLADLLANPALKFKTVGQGAATHIVAGFGECEGSGGYLDDCKVREENCAQHAKEGMERLWTLSEELVGETF